MNLSYMGLGIRFGMEGFGAQPTPKWSDIRVGAAVLTKPSRTVELSIALQALLLISIGAFLFINKLKIYIKLHAHIIFRQGDPPS